MSLFLLLQQSRSLPEGVVGAVNSFTDFLMQYAIALAAVGALAMALMEFWKKVFDSRTKFQTRRLVQWVKQNPFEDTMVHLAVSAPDGRIAEPPSQAAALGQLLQLCTGVPTDEALRTARNLLESDGKLDLFHAYAPPPAHALFALDLGRMMGSIQDAADVALASPPQNASLYLLMTRGADPNDVYRWYEEASSLSEIANMEPTPEERRRAKERADRLARLRQIVKRKLDGFQVYSGDRWASWNQGAANLVGIVLMFAALTWMQTRAGFSIGVPATIIASLLGGMLSPVAKDLVSALKRVKDG